MRQSTVGPNDKNSSIRREIKPTTRINSLPRPKYLLVNKSTLQMIYEIFFSKTQ